MDNKVGYGERDEEVSLVDGVLEGALGALGDDVEALEMEALVDVMDIDSGQDEVVFQKEVGHEEVLVQKEVCQEEVVQEKVDLAEDEEKLSEEDKDLIHE
ncbi:hypothetical protein Tco_1274476 [Tanacetum coccineum]